VNASTRLPFDVLVAGVVWARSGVPWSVAPVSTTLDADPFFDRTEPRNARRGDGFFSLDLRLAKSIRVGRHATVTPFGELFNATNAVNYIGYVNTPGAAQFGQPTAALEPRRAQFGFRVDF
jgi:hypothetical protein